MIKAIVADALGLHLDLFQRIVVDPASVTVIRYTPGRPFVVRLNDTGGALGSLVPPARPGGAGAAGPAVRRRTRRWAAVPDPRSHPRPPVRRIARIGG